MKNSKIVAAVNDLMFTVKIHEAVKRAGLECVFVKTKDDAVAQVKLGSAAVIIDLNCTAFDALELIEALKADEATREVQLLGFVSHVQIDLKKAAEDKGCDRVVARSSFSQHLPVWLSSFVV